MKSAIFSDAIDWACSIFYEQNIDCILKAIYYAGWGQKFKHKRDDSVLNDSR